MAWDIEASSTQYLSAGDLTILDGLSKFSCHAVSYLESYAARAHVLGKENFRFFFEPDPVNGQDNVPKFLISIGGDIVRAEGSTSNSFPLAEWCSFGGRFEAGLSTGIAVYINGSKVGEDSTTLLTGQTFPNVGSALTVGRRGVSHEGWDGMVDEVAIWDDVLTDQEFAALGAGVSALLIRPDALIFFSAMRGEQSTEHFWLPKSGAFPGQILDFSHQGGPTAAASGWKLTVPYQEALERDLASPSSSSFGPYTLIATLERPDPSTPPASAYTVGGLENGRQYKFKVRPKDFTGNLGNFSNEVTAEPVAGAGGTPWIPTPFDLVGDRRRLAEEESRWPAGKEEEMAETEWDE